MTAVANIKAAAAAAFELKGSGWQTLVEQQGTHSIRVLQEDQFNPEVSTRFFVCFSLIGWLQAKCNCLCNRCDASLLAVRVVVFIHRWCCWAAPALLQLEGLALTAACRLPRHTRRWWVPKPATWQS